MSQSLQLRLLGSPEIRLDDQPLATPLAAKAQALLYYLALTGRAHTRAALAGLLWGDMPEETARTNLRKALADLRPLVGAYLLTDNQMIGLRMEQSIRVDALDFATQLKAQNGQALPRAIDLYGGDLLEGFYVRNAPDFESWLLTERTHYRQAVLQALHRLASQQAEQGELGAAITTQRRLLALEPWDEEAHRTLMQWLAESGQRSAALAQFELCRRTLEAELAVEPDAATTALYKQIRAGKVDKVTFALSTVEGGRHGDRMTDDKVQENHLAPLSPPPLVTPSATHNLPESLTPLVGRTEELAQLAQMLADPACRLVTITGPGGVGKTRLALAAARASAEWRVRNFPDGVFFVALAAITSPDYIVPTIADALGLRFAGPLDVQTQLMNYLRGKQILLVVDNLEQLMSGVATAEMAVPAEASSALLLALLQAASSLTLLATSREPLHLAGEWLVELAGLPTPTAAVAATSGDLSMIDSGVGGSAGSDAVTLFLQCARRLQANFTPNAQELAAVVRICRLVEGLPLGIELAASWVRALSCQEIADEIEHNLGFLTTTQRNVPPRHRSIMAVFDHSWQLLAEEEQRVLCGLAIFRGSFTRQAAAAVTGATLPQISTLIAKSLVRRNGEQRYDLHEMVRQYAVSKFTYSPAQLAALHQQFSQYFLTWLTSREEALTSSRQKETLAACSLEIDNIRQAWQWAVAEQQYQHLRASAWTLFYFFDLRNYFQEGEAIFRHAQELLNAPLSPTNPDQQELEITSMLNAIYQSIFAYRLGRTSEAMTVFTQAIALFRHYQDEAALLETLTFYGLGCWYRGHYGEMADCQREALRLSQRFGRHWYIAWNTLLLGIALHDLGDYEQAYQLLNESVDYSRKLGDPQAISNGIAMLSRTANVLGRQQEMIGLLHEARQLAQDLDDQFSFAIATERLALSTLALGETGEAWRLLEESCTVFRQVSNVGLARLRSTMGNIALLQANTAQAQGCFLEAMAVAMQVNLLPYALDALAGLAALCSQMNKVQLALALAEVVYQHAAATPEARQRVERLVIDSASHLPTAQKEAARTRFQGQPLEAVVAEMLSHFQ